MSASRANVARKNASGGPEDSLLPATPRPGERDGDPAAGAEWEQGPGSSGSPDARGKRKRRLFQALRVTLSAALIGLVLRKASIGEVLDALAGTIAHWPYLLLALVTPGLNVAIQAARWRLLLSGVGEKRSIRTLSAALLVGVFYNQFLPSTIGGDLARSWWVSRPAGAPSLWRNLAIVALDRALALAALCAVAAAAAAAVPALVEEMPHFWPAAGAIVGAVTVAAMIALEPRVGAAARRLPLPQALGGIRRKAGLIRETLSAYRRRKGLLAAAFGLSLVFQAVMILHYLVLAGALALEVDRLSLAVTVPIISMVALVPITVNGLGLREGALAVLGAPIGLAASDAVALAWLFVFTSLAYAVAGGMIQMAGRRSGGAGGDPVGTVSADPRRGVQDERARP